MNATWLIALFVLAAVGFGVLVWHFERKRRLAMQALAAELGFRYAARDPSGLQARLERLFPQLDDGENRYAYNVVWGERNGHRLHLFDQHYETYSRDSKGRRTTHHHHRSFVAVDHDLDLGRLDLRPEGWFDKVASVFGFDDIDFESAEFSRRYHVKAQDRKLAYDVVHPQMIEFLLRVEPLHLSAAGTMLLLRRGSGRMSPTELRQLAMHAEAFLERIPRYVRKDRGGAA